jgi:hypothetical protein
MILIQGIEINSLIKLNEFEIMSFNEKSWVISH